MAKRPWSMNVFSLTFLDHCGDGESYVLDDGFPHLKHHINLFYLNSLICISLMDSIIQVIERYFLSQIKDKERLKQEE